MAWVLAVAVPASAVEQLIQPLTPPEEQRVEALGGGEDQQRVEQVDAAEAQVIARQDPPSPAQKTASVVGKVVVSVAAAAVAVGVTVASLLLL
jgi:hypothetical protein